ncbi:cytochrome P450 [Wenjunlia tyrosinilytica]|uniref:Cytochrome P450 n=1 Tax=Wenjunlia tyrosinilytica TaxID=1544741 RepID=A0A917ZWR7_9ACTN|nr:cytochrome P450 [Wenjunlia tyrosinilytica]GGO99499.1 cytochrome P450 [Wenjunlia tyrosinilytica]
MNSSPVNPVKFPFGRASECPMDPPTEYRALRERSPVVRVTLPTGDSPWLVSRYDDIREIFVDPRFSSDMTHPGYPRLYVPGERQPGAFVAMDPPDHTRYRRTVASWFTSRAAERLRPRIQEMVDALLDDLLAGPPSADLVARFSSPLPAMVICEFLGVPYPDRDRFGKWVLTLTGRDASSEQQTEAMTQLFTYMYALVEAKEAEPGDDLLGQLAGNEIRDGELTRQEVVVIGLMLLSAGFDTTASSIALSVLALLENPEQAERLTAEPALLPSAAEELLRHQNVLQYGVGRVASEDVEVAGQLIRAGEGVILLTPSGGRDPDAYPLPDGLDIGRQGPDPMTFGHGIHNCVGKFLARVEIQVAVGTLFRRIPGLRLAVPVGELPFRDDSMVYSPCVLPVTW